MKNWKKGLAVLLAGCLLSCLAACTPSQEQLDEWKSQVDALRGESSIGAGEEVRPEGVQVTQQVFSPDEEFEGDLYGSCAAEIVNGSESSVLIEYCKVDFLDREGKIIEHREVYNILPAQLEPGEKAYFGETVYLEGVRDPDEVAEMRVNVYANETTKKIERPEFFNLSPKDQSYGGVAVAGEVTNSTSRRIEFLPVLVVLFDTDDRLLAASSTYVDKLGRGENTTFEAYFWDENLHEEEIGRAEAYGFDTDLLY